MVDWGKIVLMNYRRGVRTALAHMRGKADLVFTKCGVHFLLHPVLVLCGFRIIQLIALVIVSKNDGIVSRSECEAIGPTPSGPKLIARVVVSGKSTALVQWSEGVKIGFVVDRVIEEVDLLHSAWRLTGDFSKIETNYS